ncbi:MAG: pilus assembly protein PilP [Pseudobdellovibrionaceae bacterium]
MRLKSPLYATLYAVLFLVSMWAGSIWNSRAQSEDLPPPTEQALPPDLMAPPPPGDPAAMQGQLPPQIPIQQMSPPQPGMDPMAPPGGVPAVDPNFQTLPGGLEPPVEEIPRLPAPNAEGWVYDPTGRRDPFRPFGAPKTLNPIAQVPEALLEPLQKYDVSEIKVLGILWDVSKPRALVRDPLNKVHTIFKESKIGKNQGVVVGIRESEILVQETYEEDGMPIKHVKILGIQK